MNMTLEVPFSADVCGCETKMTKENFPQRKNDFAELLMSMKIYYLSSFYVRRDQSKCGLGSGIETRTVVPGARTVYSPGNAQTVGGNLPKAGGNAKACR